MKRKRTALFLDNLSDGASNSCRAYRLSVLVVVEVGVAHQINLAVFLLRRAIPRPPRHGLHRKWRISEPNSQPNLSAKLRNFSRKNRLPSSRFSLPRGRGLQWWILSQIWRQSLEISAARTAFLRISLSLIASGSRRTRVVRFL